MTRKYSLTVLIVLLFACAPGQGNWRKVVEVQSTAQEFDVEKLGILPFKCNSETVAELLTDSMAANLLDSDIMVIERAYLGEVLKEQGLSLTGLTENSDYRKIGNLANIDFLVAGSVDILQRWGRSYILNASARVIDVDTGQVVISCHFKVPGGIGSERWTEASAVGKALAEAIQAELET